MKKDRRLLITLLIISLVSTMAFMTACSKDDEEDINDIPDSYDGKMLMTLDLESDSDNGVEWAVSQDKEIFSTEYVFLADENNENEVQSFTLVPDKSGSATVTFTNESTQTEYTYECTVNADMTEIEVENAKGVKEGQEVPAPEMSLERN